MVKEFLVAQPGTRTCASPPSSHTAVCSASGISRPLSLLPTSGFDIVFLLTGGGPENATRVLAVEVFNRAFVTYQIGRAAAVTTVMLLFLTAMTFCLLALRRTGEAD